MMQSRLQGLHRVLALAAALASSSVPLATSARAGEIGGNFPEFAANTGGLRGSFESPSAARLANGSFVLVMSYFGSNGPAAYFQMYTPEGAPLGSLTQTKSSDSPSVAAAGDGFVLVWDHWASPPEIRGQRYSASGVKLGSEFIINLSDIQLDANPKVAGLADGGFVVVWDFHPTGDCRYCRDLGEISAQRFDRQGRKVGGEFVVNTTQDKRQEAPSVAGLADGGFVVAWVSPASDGYTDIFAQRYAADGTKAGGELSITRTIGKSEINPVIAGLKGGGFVAAWMDQTTHVVFGRRFTGAGLSNGPRFRVGPHFEWEPMALSVLDDDRFLFAYPKVTCSTAGCSGDGIYARVFGPTAASGGDTREFRVNTTVRRGSWYSSPAAVALSCSNLFVMWEMLPNGGGVANPWQVRLRRLYLPAE